MGGGQARGASSNHFFRGTLQVCFFSLPCSLLPTPSNSSCTPARLTTSSPPLDFALGCCLSPNSPPLENHFPFLIRPFSLPFFLPSFLLRSFHLVRSISGLKTINLLPLSLARRPGNFLHFSSYFRPPPPCHAASFCLLRQDKREWDETESTLVGSFDTYCCDPFLTKGHWP